VVPYHLQCAAKRYIHHHIGERNARLNLTNDPLTKFATGGSGDPAIIDLFNKSDLLELVHTLIYGNDRGDEAKVASSKVGGGQIALRYPQMGEPPVSGKLGGRGWHIDGLDQGTHSTFDLLVGVCLSDQTNPWSGNLVLHKGSHHVVHQLIKRNSLPAWPEEEDAIRVGLELRTLIQGLDLGEPVQVLMQPGDCVIVHQKTGHLGGPNYFHEIRNMIYFRLSHRLLKERGDLVLQDVFYNLEGLHDVLK